MDFTDILYQVDGAVATIHLDRPKSLNAITPNLLAELGAALDLADGNPVVRAILLTGSGRGFSSGADLFASKPAQSADGRHDLGAALTQFYNPLILKMQALKLPIVAAVNGMAAGAGASLALMADVTIASTSAVFLEAFIHVGLLPDAGATWLLSRLLGAQRAMGLTLLGEKFSAQQAKDWGLIWDVVPDDELMASAHALAARLAAGPKTATSNIKAAVHAAARNDLAQQLALEAELQRQCGRTDDFAEGVKAFAEKRKPVFTTG